MALFRSDPDSAVAKTDRPTANPAEQHNIIGATTTVEGTLRSSGNVNISGTVDGNVEVEGRTMVMPGGVVEGEVTSTSAEIAGTVHGRVVVTERLVLKASAVIDGDIRTGKLVIEDGATFNGQCQMGPATSHRATERATERAGGAAVVGTVGAREDAA
ncbi:bactofilin family protein [Rubrivirga sp.]|uniref:bactofilin family protein n=1 Tax=Rubrivirga sp. TaxID=1885344 RepID=UPI003B522380